MYQAGDWIKATETIEEQDFPQPGYDFTHAEPGYVGHVFEARADGLLDVFFERSGGTTVVHPRQVVRLGGAETGR
jgi:hypothetical protein